MDVVLFETDVRPQELWSPASTNYRVLWQKTLKASEK
jgi:hypothetical protein